VFEVGRSKFIFFLSLLTCFLFSPSLTHAQFPKLIVRLSLPQTDPTPGRLFVIFSQTNNPEPRVQLSRVGPSAPYVIARDVCCGCGPSSEDTVPALTSEQPVILGKQAFSFPLTNLAAIPPGDYFAQAVFDGSSDLRSISGPGNLLSSVQKVHLDSSKGSPPQLEFSLTSRIPEDKLPPDTELTRFLKIPSKLLSDFHQRPMFLRVGVALPAGYSKDATRRFPLWVRIGGINARYSSLSRLLDQKGDFYKIWTASNTPPFLLLQLDGAGPNGDPYQVNSANNGPYGDALIQEIIPDIEKRFRGRGTAQSRVLSGTSTGGWVALALQIFYADFFNGAWAACPDPVDFRALELLNIYEDQSAFVNRHLQERPSERQPNEDTILTMRQEVGVENLLGRGNSYISSGEQWGDWTAVFGSRGPDGKPVPIWDPQTGAINREIAEQWKKYDLSLVLKSNWASLVPKLKNKLNISAGESDQYFLNNAVHLLDDFFKREDASFSKNIHYGPGQGHGWSFYTTEQLLREFTRRTESTEASERK
jgi:hypothetical protein